MMGKLTLCFVAVAVVFVTGWCGEGALAANPEVILPGTGASLRGIYMQYTEHDHLHVDQTIEAFLGIPYAQPPVGDLRFEAPVESTIEGTYLATKDRPMCEQFSPVDDALLMPIKRDVDEDCLYLGVHVASPRPQNAAVLVWIHGGGFILGAGSDTIYEPLPIVALAPDVIFVTLNYRLGVYGYMTTGDSASPGNYGMLDQVMALRWVQNNIAAFGGDPTRVTIMGESAGGASVGLHLLSPLTQGLFSQAIMESGNALCPWAVDTNINRQIAFTEEIAELVGCSKITNDNMVQCMKGVDFLTLTRAQMTITARHLVNEPMFVPVVDNFFLPKTPYEIVAANEFHSVPTLLGTNEDEGTLIAFMANPLYVLSQEPPTMTLEDLKIDIPRYLFYSSPELDPAVGQWYVDWTQADDSSANQVDAFINVNTDQYFACSTEAMARAMVQTGAPIYRYEMTHDPSSSIIAGLPGWMGAGHAEELQYVFAWGLNHDLVGLLKQQTEEEKAMSVQFMRYWTDFIRTGDPNGVTGASSAYPEWPIYTLPEQSYKKLSLTMENGRAPRMDACAFWLNYAPDVYNYRARSEGNTDLMPEWGKLLQNY